MMRKVLVAIALAAVFAAVPPSRGQAQEDILDLASKLTAKSSELQKVQDQLANKREEVKKETIGVQAEEKKVETMKAAAKGGAPLVGPFTLFMGQFSNTADLQGGGAGEKIPTFAEARAKGEKHMADARGKQPSYRIEDKSGTVVEADGLFRRKKMSAEQLAATMAPKPDTGALAAAEKALADRKATSDRSVQQYKAALAAYDKDLADYNTAVDRLNQSLPAAIQEAGTPTPTTEQLNAPKGDYQVEDLGAAATKYKGQTAKDGTAVAFVQEVAKVPDPSKWGKGIKVEGATLRAGTPIATFKANGTFTPGKGQHAAIYISQNKKGIWVYDQYKTAGGVQRPVDARFIRFQNGTGSNNASAYSVIKKAVKIPDLPPVSP